MQVLDREAAIAAWRRAESRIYPSVMLNAELYQQYIGLVRAIAALLEDVHTEDELVVGGTARRAPGGGAHGGQARRRGHGAPRARPRARLAVPPADAGPDGPRGGTRRRVL